MDKNNIEILEKNRCTGCGVCVNSCPVSAIRMTTDAEGFIVPEVNNSICINCGLCSKTCPALNLRKENNKIPEMYAVRADDEIRKVSSSGGVFSVLAEYVLKEGGFVCGAAFDENMQLNHVMVDSIADLPKLRGSKYLQSNPNTIYKQVREKLKENKKVLFVGTPCQVAALKNYVGDNNNLILVDILCHGVPSQSVFNKYLSEISGGKKVTDVYFRDKKFGWSAETIEVKFNDGTEYVNNKSNGDAFETAFHTNLMLRKSCSDCSFSEFPRHGDISIGDFWGISAVDRTQNDGKGTSMVLANNPKGIDIVKNVLMRQTTALQLPFTDKIPNRIRAEYRANKNRERFFEMNNAKRFSDSVPQSMQYHYDIGLVSNYCALNFGGSLTQYALYNVLTDMGYSVLMIERPANAAVRIPSYTKDKCYNKWPYPEYSEARQYPTKDSMRELNNFCDTFVVGSDQLWQNSLYNELGGIFDLDWVNGTKKKIAYAASFGFDYVWGAPEQLAEMSYFMQQFDAFSVRELSGVTVAKRNFGVDAVHVLDPVFLVDQKHYDRLMVNAGEGNKGSYISSYILDVNEDKKNILRYVSSNLNLEVDVFAELGNRNKDQFSDFKYVELKGESRLQCIKNSKFFIGDSFHGTCLAILFNVPFVSIVNKNRGGARFTSLLEYFGLQDRMVESYDELLKKPHLFEPVDFKPVNEKLKNGRKFSLDWLRSSLQQPKENKDSLYDILMNRLDDRSRSYERLLRFENIKNNAVAVNKKFYLVSDIKNYLQLLAVYQDELIIDIAVKDTPGFSFTPDIDNLFKRLGLKQSLVGKHQQSYIAVLNGKTVVNEQLNGRGDRIAYVGNVNNIDLKTVSISFTKGNLAANIVNGVEYSENRRGINIVVIDKNTNLVIDSVCFDTHDPQIPCSRFGKKSDIDLTAKLLEGMLQGQQQEINACLDRLNAVERENAAAASKLEAMTSRYETLDAEYNQLKGSHAALENSFAQAESALAQKQRELEQSVKENSDLKAENQSANARLQELEAHYTDIQKSLSFRTGRAITFIPRKIRNLFKKK